jgi:hypothetical protein
MPPSKCPGCQKEFEDPRGFANHKRRCILVNVVTARHFKQLKARGDKGKRKLTQASQAGAGNVHVEEGQGGPTTIAADGDNGTSMPLVCLDLLLIVA